MDLAVVIEPLPGQRGFAAHLGPPFNLSAEAATAEEAHQQVAALLRLRMRQGLELRAISVPVGVERGPEPGWLPDDELTGDWLEQVRQYRLECDAADRRRLLEPLPEDDWFFRTMRDAIEENRRREDGGASPDGGPGVESGPTR